MEVKQYAQRSGDCSDPNKLARSRGLTSRPSRIYGPGTCSGSCESASPVDMVAENQFAILLVSLSFIAFGHGSSLLFVKSYTHRNIPFECSDRSMIR